MQVTPPQSSWASAAAPALCTLKEVTTAPVSPTGVGSAETCAVETSDRLTAKTTLKRIRNMRSHNIFKLTSEVDTIHNLFNWESCGFTPDLHSASTGFRTSRSGFAPLSAREGTSAQSCVTYLRAFFRTFSISRPLLRRTSSCPPLLETRRLVGKPFLSKPLGSASPGIFKKLPSEVLRKASMLVL